MRAIALPTAPGRPVWRAAQIIGVVTTFALIAALWLVPGPSLRILWDAVIPLLPAVFLVNPLLWRNVCPLATLNEYSGNVAGTRTLGPPAIAVWWAAGIGLLFILVPARRFLFNENGPALAITVTLVAVAALAAGLRYAGRAGFCNSICPVLPVEKLYGQAPLFPMHGARCGLCTVCTPAGCIDLATTKAVTQTVGPARRDAGWLTTGFGAFAAAFPGFIVAYYTTDDGGLASLSAVYVKVAAFSLISYAVIAGTTRALSIRATFALPLLAATSLGLYYWFAAPVLADAYRLGDTGMWLVRVAIGLALAWWLWRALPRQPVAAPQGP